MSAVPIATRAGHPGTEGAGVSPPAVTLQRAVAVILAYPARVVAKVARHYTLHRRIQNPGIRAGEGLGDCRGVAEGASPFALECDLPPLVPHRLRSDRRLGNHRLWASTCEEWKQGAGLGLPRRKALTCAKSTAPRTRRSAPTFKTLRVLSVAPNRIPQTSINQPNRMQSNPVMGRCLGSQAALIEMASHWRLGWVSNFQQRTISKDSYNLFSVAGTRAPVDARSPAAHDGNRSSIFALTFLGVRRRRAANAN
jgi:hypothetical protein